LRGMARICTACATPADDEVATTIDDSEDIDEAADADAEADAEPGVEAGVETDDKDAGFVARLYAAEGVADTATRDGVAAPAPASLDACGDGLSGEADTERA
jgi:hypothetical protein